jgi:hypothetical protein
MAWGLSCREQHWARAYIEEIDDALWITVENEAVRSIAHAVTLAGRKASDVRGQFARHPEQHSRKLIRQPLLAAREKHFAALACRNVQVEQEAGAVSRRNLPQAIGYVFWISVSGLPVSDVQDRWRIACGVRIAPIHDRLGSFSERSAHWSAARASRIKPDWKLNTLVDYAASAIIGLLCALLYSQRVFTNPTDRLN